MTHKFTLPSEAEIENLITKVYEDMPNPDQSRLSLIQSKLLQKARKNKAQKNLNKTPWWIVLVLAGGLVSAAWWAGEIFFDKQNSEIDNGQTVSSDKITGQQPIVNDLEFDEENNKQNNKAYENNDSPVIYQRESF